MRANIKADDGRDIPIMTMGPICITPELKRQGFGKKLLDYSLNKGISFMFGGKLVWNGGNKTINAVNMTVDNLRIYNGRALNASEVMQVYEYESR